MAMLKEYGNKKFPIWLLGDSNPVNFHQKLTYPLDPLHPARHNIWTPILDAIQEKVYIKNKKRIDSKDIYIRNAVYDSAIKPARKDIAWMPDVQKEINEYGDLIKEYKPIIIFSFGSFSYEFLLRSIKRGNRAYNHWDTKNLGEDFRNNLNQLNTNATNPIPLLHTSISRGRFLEAHKYYCAGNGDNYFQYTGEAIANILLQNQSYFTTIWH